MKAGDTVRIVSDDWALNGKLAVVVNPVPVPASSRCLLEVEDRAVTLPFDEVIAEHKASDRGRRAVSHLRVAV